MKSVDVIIPTLGHIKKTSHPFTCFKNLYHIPWPICLHVITEGKTWAEAINIGIKQANPMNDIIIMDDDVFINEATFSNVWMHFSEADIFGFKLLFPNGKVQHAGGLYRKGMIGHIGHGEDPQEKFDHPYYVCHATTSLIYIKRKVIDRLKGMSEDIPGIQMEDVDFSFRAIKNGFKILYTPGEAIHIESATKRIDNNMSDGIVKAYHEIKKRHVTNSFAEVLESYPKPFVEELLSA
jgi:GT2 family glycosyltransferase